MIYGLIFAACCGYVASKLMNTSGAWYVYVLLGLAGGFVGNLVFGVFGFSSTSTIGDIIVSIVGSIIVILVYQKLKK